MYTIPSEETDSLEITRYIVASKLDKNKMA
jgi:hypothetical protein